MATLTYFCPGCGAGSGRDTSTCPRCDYRMLEYHALPFESKLILSLKHPIRETRMLAIELLGELRSRAAVPAIEALLRDEEDPFVLGEVARALGRIGGEGGRAILQRLRSSRSKVVSDFAEAAWREWMANDALQADEGG